MFPTVLFLVNTGADPNGTHRTSVRAFAAAYARHGYWPRLIDLAAPGFGKRLVAEFAEPGLAFLHCEQGWGLEFLTGGGLRDAVEARGLPVLSHIRDYPFSPWLTGKFDGLPPTVKVFHTDALAPELVAAMTGSAAGHAFAPHVYFDFAERAEPVAAGKRPTRGLYVGSWQDPDVERRTYIAGGTPADLLDDMFDAFRDNYTRPVTEVAAAVLDAHGYAASFANPSVGLLLFQAHVLVRAHRRMAMLRRLASYPLRIVWRGPLPPVPLHPRTEVRPGCSVEEMLALADDARIFFISLNSFTHSLSERLLSAMYRGCVAATTGNALVDASFVNGKDCAILRPDLDDLEAVWEISDDDASAIGVRARAAVRDRYAPDRRAAEFLSALGLASV